MDLPCYTEGVTARRCRRRRNPPAMTRPDPKNIKLAGSGTTPTSRSDWKKISSVVPSDHVIVPAICKFPVSKVLQGLLSVHTPSPAGLALLSDRNLNES